METRVDRIGKYHRMLKGIKLNMALEILAAHDAGVSDSVIAQTLGLSRQSVTKFRKECSSG